MADTSVVERNGVLDAVFQAVEELAPGAFERVYSTGPDRAALLSFTKPDGDDEYALAVELDGELTASTRALFPPGWSPVFRVRIGRGDATTFTVFRKPGSDSTQEIACTVVAYRASFFGAPAKPTPRTPGELCRQVVKAVLCQVETELPGVFETEPMAPGETQCCARVRYLAVRCPDDLHRRYLTVKYVGVSEGGQSEFEVRVGWSAPRVLTPWATIIYTDELAASAAKLATKLAAFYRSIHGVDSTKSQDSTRVESSPTSHVMVYDMPSLSNKTAEPTDSPAPTPEEVHSLYDLLTVLRGGHVTVTGDCASRYTTGVGVLEQYLRRAEVSAKPGSGRQS